MPQATTSILLFSRSARAEARLKGFGTSQVGDLRVVQAMIRRTEVTLGRSGLPVLRSDERNQRGVSFGERLGNAIADAFASGVERLIVVGNDCPDLTARHLRAAARYLERGHNLLGPDHRGGAWLLGLQRQDFDLVRFAGLSWESDHLLTDLEALLPTAISLTHLADLNSMVDLRRAWWRIRTALSVLAPLLRRTQRPFSAFIALLGAAANPVTSLRGPPRMA